DLECVLGKPEWLPSETLEIDESAQMRLRLGEQPGPACEPRVAIVPVAHRIGALWLRDRGYRCQVHSLIRFRNFECRIVTAKPYRIASESCEKVVKEANCCCCLTGALSANYSDGCAVARKAPRAERAQADSVGPRASAAETLSVV